MLLLTLQDRAMKQIELWSCWIYCFYVVDMVRKKLKKTLKM